jgi:BASS family bile acid:Na+ symporter
MFDFYREYEHQFAQVQLTLFMIAMGTNLAPRDFLQIAVRPRSSLTALLAHLVLLPAVAVAINYLGGLEAGIAVGLILTSAMPGGALSKFFTYLSRGNAALSISLSVILTLATPLTVPAMLSLLAGEYLPREFSLPVGRIIFDVAAFLLAPLVIGLILGQQKPAYAQHVARWCVRVGVVVIILMITGSLGSGRIRPGDYGVGPPVAIIVFCLLSQQLSMLPFRLLRWPWQDTVAVGIEATMRNMNLALLIKASLFPLQDEFGDRVLFVVLYYAGAAMIAGFPLALRYRLRSRREALASPAPSKVES